MDKMTALVDFLCLDEECGKTINFNVMELKEKEGLLTCPHCYRQYSFSDSTFIEKLEKLRNLLIAVKDAEDILGDVNVGVNTVAGSAKIPYRLLLTRMNTVITLEVGGYKIDFNFRVEPAKSGDFH
ncbi:hypothetical protein LNTAR_24019 [Lentisphaera araneosa HTCC2155]|jgi:hypothetical protein|uniref:Uncharacterized protein n=1 Tax=Lentisphaera araneosa HTCC2155 TaxID=313628 RepID=A6DPZ2_9BACT|nr:hypothetical protein [Lentisphaera araneosa]EDM26233.1 hypothetical protein LNTAR_24019 [Lentisphaera araneosa HTCC2155]